MIIEYNSKKNNVWLYVQKKLIFDINFTYNHAILTGNTENSK
jgi:hypothetical protein